MDNGPSQKLKIRPPRKTFVSHPVTYGAKYVPFWIMREIVFKMNYRLIVSKMDDSVKIKPQEVNVSACGRRAWFLY